MKRGSIVRFGKAVYIVTEVNNDGSVGIITSGVGDTPRHVHVSQLVVIRK